MDPSTENIVEKPQKLKGNRNISKLLAIVAILLLVVANGGIYLWQNSKAKDLKSQIVSLENTKKTQGKIISSQIVTIADLKDQLKVNETEPLPVEEDTSGLKVTVKSATRIDTTYGGKDYIAVTVSLNNDGSTQIPFDLSSFKLTDANNNRYQSLREQHTSNSDYTYVLSILNLPENSTVLTDQTINKGETAAGTLIFYAHNTISSFTLSYLGTNYQVSLN